MVLNGNYGVIKNLTDTFLTFTLSGVLTPSDECMENYETRKGFHITTYKDEEMKVALETIQEGMDIQISCKDPCKTCMRYRRGFCFSCKNPKLALM